MHWMVWYHNGKVITELDTHWDQVDKTLVKTLALVRPYPQHPISIDLDPGDTPIQKKHGIAFISVGSPSPHLGRNKCVAFEIGKQAQNGDKIYYIIDALTGEAECKEELWQDS